MTVGLETAPLLASSTSTPPCLNTFPGVSARTRTAVAVGLCLCGTTSHLWPTTELGPCSLQCGEFLALVPELRPQNLLNSTRLPTSEEQRRTKISKL